VSNERLIFMIENYNNFSGARQAYIKRVILSLRPLSFEKKNTKVMIDEWYFQNLSENVREVNYLNCELCGQPENVYQFRIVNKITNNYIWTGSVCIENFSIPVYNKTGKLVTSEKEINDIFKDNKKDIKEQKRLVLIESLINDINKSGKNFTMTDENREKGVYTLKQLKFISLLYKEVYDNFIPEDYISLFKVNMRLKRNTTELLNLKPFHWAQFYPIFGKYMFDTKHGFTNDVRISAKNIINKYRPEYLENFLKKAV